MSSMMSGSKLSSSRRWRLRNGRYDEKNDGRYENGWRRRNDVHGRWGHEFHDVRIKAQLILNDVQFLHDVLKLIQLHELQFDHDGILRYVKNDGRRWYGRNAFFA